MPSTCHNSTTLISSVKHKWIIVVTSRFNLLITYMPYELDHLTPPTMGQVEEKKAFCKALFYRHLHFAVVQWKRFWRGGIPRWPNCRKKSKNRLSSYWLSAMTLRKKVAHFTPLSPNGEVKKLTWPQVTDTKTSEIYKLQIRHPVPSLKTFGWELWVFGMNFCFRS